MNSKHTIDDALPTTGSLQRANILITAIARGSRRGSSLTELVARTGLPRPTIHRVLDTLIRMAWVQRDVHTARYNLGRDLAAIGYSAISRNPVEAVAAPVLSQLASAVDRVVYLNVRSELDMVCIGRYESPTPDARDRGRVGLRGPLGMSPGCLAIFCCLPQAEIEDIIAANLSRYHRIQGFDETRFRAAVAYARQQGYGTYDHIVLDKALSALAVAVLDSDQQPLAAIGLTYDASLYTPKMRQQLLLSLQQAAAQISCQV